jgi:ribose transport system permease protein
MSSDVRTEDLKTAPMGRRMRQPKTSSLLQRYALLIAWGVLILVFSLLHPGEYLTGSHIASMFSTQATLVVLAISAITPLLAGDLDLSVAANLALAQVLFVHLDVNEGWPVGRAAVVTLAVSIVVGLVNSTLVVGFGIDSIVITLGMSTLLAGLALSLGATPILGVSPDFVGLIRHRFLGLQVAFYVAVALCLLLWLVVTQTTFGRRLLFVGANRNSARLAGLRVAQIRSTAFVSASLLSGTGGIMLAGLFGSADANTAPTLLLPALAAVFLGATAFTPGRFNVPGTFIAVYFLVFGISGLEMSGLSGWVSQVFYGGSLIVAVLLSTVGGRFYRRTRGAARS